MSVDKTLLQEILGNPGAFYVNVHTTAFPDGPPDWPPSDPAVQVALAAAAADGSWGQYHGDHIPALEADLAAFHGVPHALTCASGTLAVEAALRALKVGPGDDMPQNIPSQDEIRRLTGA